MSTQLHPGFTPGHAKLCLPAGIGGREKLAFWLAAALLAACFGPWSGLSAAAASSLAIGGLALVAWTLLRWDDTPVALVAALALVATPALPTSAFYGALGHPLIWLLLGAFILAGAWRSSGLVQSWTLAALGTGLRLDSLLRRLTWLIAATAFIVPSTSARAALMLPVYLVLAPLLPAGRPRTALALLFPTVILLSAAASLLGAGAHLVAADAIGRLTGQTPGLLWWAWIAGPFAALSCFVACEILIRLFLCRSDRRRHLALPAAPSWAWTGPTRALCLISAGALLAWASSPWHGVDAAVIAMLAALAATCKPLTGIALKTVLKQVEWNLLLFLAATLVLGQALLDSGAAAALAQGLRQALPLQALGPLGLCLLAAVIALLSHLWINSRTARAVVLIPTVALPLAALGPGLDASLLVMLTVIGSGFCQTFQVSAKPVALFAGADRPGYSDADLLRLALWLFGPLLLLLVFFSTWVWPLQGLG
jgi:solute carrier family 13 (sodium-dependent dicarboxylate transporter), member 2/3/5